MIEVNRITGNEREVLHAALKAYDVFLYERARGSTLAAQINDVRWRQRVVAELLDLIDAR